MAKTSLSSPVRLMSVHEKRAWFILIVSLVTCLVYVALIPVLGTQAAMASFSICGLLGLTPLLFRRKHEIDFDERDTMLLLKVTRATWIIFYLSFVFGCMTLWFVQCIIREQTTITIKVYALPMIVMAGGIMAWGASAIATIILYRRS